MLGGVRGASCQVNHQVALAIPHAMNNTNAVAKMDTPFTNDPPTLSDIELMRAKYNELVLALRR
jgi:hypothetical protein